MRYQKIHTHKRKEFSNSLKETIFLKYKGKCVDCGLLGNGLWNVNQNAKKSQRKKSFLISKLQIHHIIKVRNGGTNSKDNLILLCHQCHIMRHKI